MKSILVTALLLATLACVHRVQIEPSDKPFVVNLNVKVDHEIRVKIEDQNKDLLDLETEAIKSKKSTGGK